MMTIKDLKEIISNYNDTDIVCLYDEDSSSEVELNKYNFFSETKSELVNRYNKIIDGCNERVPNSLNYVYPITIRECLSKLTDDNSNVLYISFF